MDEKNKILIVEDEKDTRFILDKLLTKNNYSVMLARNGEEALKILENFHPHVVLADWTMPIMDGVELCKIMKSNENLKLIYFIILTARATVKDRVTGLDVGADDFLVKPVENQELLARLRTGVRIHKLQNELKTIEHNKAILEMACTIGHKINNPLSAISLSIQNIKDELKKPELNSHREDFDVIEQSLKIINRLVNELIHLQSPDYIEYTSNQKMIKLS